MILKYSKDCISVHYFFSEQLGVRKVDDEEKLFLLVDCKYYHILELGEQNFQGDFLVKRFSLNVLFRVDWHFLCLTLYISPTMYIIV